MLKKYKTSFESYIGGYYIDNKICDSIVEYFKTNKDKSYEGFFVKRGKNLVDKKIKDSIDIGISPTNYDSPLAEYRNALQSCLDSYCKTYKSIQGGAHFNINFPYVIQHYPPGGGYKNLHYEAVDKNTSDRVLVFMTYLNDVAKAGTEFPYQKLITPCKKGLTLIWPPGFTHPHKGVVNKTKEKYIVTGWFTYD